MYTSGYKKQKIFEWLRNGFPRLSGTSDEELSRAAVPPDESVYDHLSSVSRIVLHHSATEKGSAVAFRILHRVLFHWDDIGYHYVIGNGTFSDDGEIQEGRPLWAVGAHARGGNQDSIGICLVGDFRDRTPTQAQFESLFRLTQKLIDDFRLKPTDVIAHSKVKTCSTVCPGGRFPLKELRQRLRGSGDLP